MGDGKILALVIKDLHAVMNGKAISRRIDC